MSISSSKLDEFADTLVNRAARVEKGDNVYLLATSLQSLPLFEKVRRKIIKKGGQPHEHLLYDSQVGTSAADYDYLKYAPEEQLQQMSEAKMEEMKRMDAYIRIGGDDNTRELSDVNSKRISQRRKATEEILTERMKKKWVATRYPTEAMAQEASMSTPDFQQMLVNAVTEIDWEKLEEKNSKVKEVFDYAEEVRIVGKDTDLTLSLSDREGIPDNGRHNVPSGEVFYAPVKDSLEGHIKFSYPAVDGGNEVKGVYLEFEKGKIVDFQADENEEYLKNMIGTDGGSHYIGELGIGTNRQITRYVKETILDEKIGGTVHLAIGRAYDKCMPEGKSPNQSGIHWDIVKDLRPKGGGGELIVDGETVQKDGEWVF